MVGFLLSWYGYDAGRKRKATAINGIVLLFTVIPGAAT
jgi:Na+/melibiose symporter-like transporter